VESWVGKRLGKVQIESLVGRGGAAEVYLGTHTTLGRKVAVKILRNLNEENSDALARFEREARAVAKLRHPNIVQVHDFDTIDNNPYLVMEYIEGPSLSKYLNTLHQNRARLPLSQAVHLIRAVASALQYAHNNRVIHRDVKPGNILLTSPSKHIEVGKPLPEDFEPVLTDFGLVRFMDGHRQTTTGHIAGTPAYMSPEQARGEATDGRADIYSLGIVLYEILAGDVPFDGESTVSILLKQVKEPPPPIPGLSSLLQNVLDRALAKDVRNRFQIPMEFADALSMPVNMKSEAATIQFTEAQPIQPPLKMQQPVKVEPPAKRSTSWLRISALAVIAVVLGSFLLIKDFPSFASKNITPTTPAPSATDILLPLTSTSTPTAIVPTGPIGFLRFQNGSAIADQVSLTTEAMPPPPLGSQYEIWLTGAGEHLSLGVFTPDQDGQGELTFSDPEGVNLLSHYGGLEVTIEPNPDTDLKPSGLTVYAFTLPEEGLVHVRYLLSTFSRTPDKSALIQGLHANIRQTNELAQEMQTASDSGDQKTVLQKAETALNLLVGTNSADYKDWNGDGKTEPRGSYGLLLNGSEFGYIQASYAEADYIIANTSGATQYTYMIANGEVVKTCAQNMVLWAPELRKLLLAIINSTPDSDTSGSISALVTLTDQILNGIDADKNGTIDIVSGECGAETTYEYAYRMADMPILPAGLSDQLTAVANSTLFPTNAVVQSGSEGTPGVTGTAGANTPQPNPTKEAKPTKETKPTNDSGGNNNGGGNNGGGNNGGGNNGGGNDKPPKEPKDK